MSAHTAQRVEGLTPREREVFEDLVVGQSNRKIADKLGISPRTVEVHRARVMKKMQAQSLPHLVRMAIEIEAEEKA
jgi:two-component system response regulator FixJ